MRPVDKSHPMFRPTLLHFLYVEALEAYARRMAQMADLAAELCEG